MRHSRMKGFDRFMEHFTDDIEYQASGVRRT
jgi:hypothetical protein